MNGLHTRHCCRPPLSKRFGPEVLQIINDAWAQDPKDRLVGAGVDAGVLLPNRQVVVPDHEVLVRYANPSLLYCGCVHFYLLGCVCLCCRNGCDLHSWRAAAVRGRLTTHMHIASNVSSRLKAVNLALPFPMCPQAKHAGHLRATGEP